MLKNPVSFLAAKFRCCTLLTALGLDEDAHAASAVTMVEMTRFATDRMNSIASAIVPLIYYGEHDPDDSISKLWKDAWENLTSGIPDTYIIWITRLQLNLCITSFFRH